MCMGQCYGVCHAFAIEPPVAVQQSQDSYQKHFFLLYRLANPFICHHLYNHVACSATCRLFNKANLPIGMEWERAAALHVERAWNFNQDLLRSELEVPV